MDVMDKSTPKKASKETSGKVSATSSRADSIVTARVPTEIKEQGNKVLKKIGSTPTELVNAAYMYVLDREELPQVIPTLDELRNKRRMLTPEQKDAVRKRMQETTLRAPAEWGTKSFKELLDQAREERYARFA